MMSFQTEHHLDVVQFFLNQNCLPPGVPIEMHQPRGRRRCKYSLGLRESQLHGQCYLPDLESRHKDVRMQ